MKRIISLFLSLVIVVGLVSAMPVSVSAANTMVENAINWAVGIANYNNYGYSQVNRYGNPDYDCSSLVSTAFHNAGFNVACELNTYTMKDAFVNAGFTWIPASQISGFPGSCANLQRGDILLATNHTELYIGNGKNVGAHMDYNGIPGGIGGGSTWSDGYNAYRYGADEIDVCNYWNDNWLGVLRYNGTDDGLANIGDDFYAVILNTAYWKPITANSNASVTLEKECGVAKQLWYFDRQDDGSYVITSASNGNALEMDCGYTTPGNPVVYKEYWGGNYQKWSIYKQGDGYVFVSKHYPEYNLAITLSNNSSADGTKITTSTRCNDSSQIFSIYSGDEVQLKPATLSVSVGNSATGTKFSWNEVYGENWYDLKIWKDQLHVGEAYHIEWGAKSGCAIQLPAGTYYAYVDALNHYQCKMSNVVTFTVSEKIYNITYNANGGSGAPASQTKTYGQTLTLSSTKPTRSGYTFLGWSTSSTATKATYSAGGSFTTNANTTLYAVWQKNHTHSYMATVTQAPTCTETGIKTYRCSCGASYIQTISATGHTESDWLRGFPASVHSAGSKHKECTECGEVLETEIIPQLKCAVPKITKAENTSSGVKVTWGKVTGADSYRIYRKESGGTYKKLADTTSTSYTDKTAKSGKRYYYVVKAENEAGFTEKSASKGVIFLARPKISAIANKSNGVKIAWGKVSGAKEYKVYRKVSGGSYKYLGKTTSTSYTDKTAKSGKKYYYVVKTVNGSYVSEKSASKGITFVGTPTIKTPTTAKAGVTVKWASVSGAEGYVIYRKTGSGSYTKIATVKGGSKVSCLDKSAKKGKKYTYKVKAYKGSAYSVASSGKTITDKY